MTTNLDLFSRRAQFLVFCLLMVLIIEAVFNALVVFARLLEMQMIINAESGIRITASQAESNHYQQRLIAFGHYGVVLLGIMLFLVWVNRANHNARALGAEGMQFSPGWAVGCFFVPVVNFVTPYLAIREIWQASAPDAGQRWQATNPSPILGVWWVVWAFFTVCHVGSWWFPLDSSRLTKLADRRLAIDGLMNSAWVAVAANLFALAGLILLMVVITTIHGLQLRKHTQIVLSERLEPKAPSTQTL